MKYLLIVASIAILTSCGGAKKSVENAVPPPEWVSSRPISAIYYSGIGIARKWGSPDNYKSEARQIALADMASQINAKISTTSVLYQVENKKGVSEMLSSNVKSSSKEFLEGYEEVGSYEDDGSYYVYFRLSKQKFAELKMQRKMSATENAVSKYKEALNEEASGHTYSSLKIYSSTLEAMSDYLGDENICDVNGENVDVCIESVKKIRSLMNALSIVPVSKNVNAHKGEELGREQLAFKVIDDKSVVQPNIPVKFKYSGGYLRKDTDLSNSEGVVGTIIYNVNGDHSGQSLCAEIDIVNLTRSLTTNLLVRKLIDDSAGNSGCITINID